MGGTSQPPPRRMVTWIWGGQTDKRRLITFLLEISHPVCLCLLCLRCLNLQISHRIPPPSTPTIHRCRHAVRKRKVTERRNQLPRIYGENRRKAENSTGLQRMLLVPIYDVVEASLLFILPWYGLPVLLLFQQSRLKRTMLKHNYSPEPLSFQASHISHQFTSKYEPPSLTMQYALIGHNAMKTWMSCCWSKDWSQGLHLIFPISWCW
jgi:hypothetical protein